MHNLCKTSLEIRFVSIKNELYDKFIYISGKAAHASMVRGRNFRGNDGSTIIMDHLASPYLFHLAGAAETNHTNSVDGPNLCYR